MGIDNKQHLVERFDALYKLVDDAHSRCKQSNSLDTLIDAFGTLHCLIQAFQEDCDVYLPLCQDLEPVIERIHNRLHCSMVHVHESANRLDTRLIHHFISQLAGPRIPN